VPACPFPSENKGFFSFPSRKVSRPLKMGFFSSSSLCLFLSIFFRRHNPCYRPGFSTSSSICSPPSGYQLFPPPVLTRKSKPFSPESVISASFLHIEFFFKIISDGPRRFFFFGSFGYSPLQSALRQTNIFATSLPPFFATLFPLLKPP